MIAAAVTAVVLAALAMAHQHRNLRHERVLAKDSICCETLGTALGPDGVQRVSG